MENRFIIIVWHQAGGNNNGHIYYPLTNSGAEIAIVFESKKEAENYWKENRCGDVHAGLVVNATASENEWI